MTYKEAYEKVIAGVRFEDLEILSLANAYGSTVAHEQADRGWEPKTKEAKAYILAERLKE